MKVRYVAAAVLALSVATAGLASAQGGRGQGRPGMGGGGLFMLRIKEVQTELKMTEPQIAKLETKQQETMQAMQELRQGVDFQNLTPEDRAKMAAKGQEIQTKAVNDVLDTTQQKRFKQLELQQIGVGGAINRKDVAEALKITDEQKKKIQDIQTTAREEMQASFQGVDFRNMTPEDRTKLGEKMAASQKATGDKVMAVLTDTQKKQWAEMTGPAFKFPAGGFGFGGPGGGRRPGGQPPVL
jgi:hypothetical protein